MRKSSSGYRTIEPTKKQRKKDYHSEKILSGDPKKGVYNVAVSGKKGNERYSKSLVRSEGGKRMQATKTRTLKTPSGKKTTTSYSESRETKPGVNRIKGKVETKSKRKVAAKRKTKKK